MHYSSGKLFVICCKAENAEERDIKFYSLIFKNRDILILIWGEIVYPPGNAKPFDRALSLSGRGTKKTAAAQPGRKRSFQLGEMELVNAVGCVFKRKKLEAEEDCLAEECYENKLSGGNG